MRKHLDLFSGIGGFALAARWAGFETVQFCEIDPYCQKVLAKNFPEAQIHGDIRTFDTDEFVRRCGDVELLTGGFPCQPFSLAGKRLGAKDDRYLWHEMRRVIEGVRPRWIVGENVASLTRFVEFEHVVSDLEALNYTVQPVIIPACAVNTLHQRSRVWIIANTNGRRQSGQRSFRDAVYSKANTERQADWSQHGCIGNLWQSEPSVGRVANGIPARVDRLRGLGNAIVPQVAYQILRQIV